MGLLWLQVVLFGLRPREKAEWRKFQRDTSAWDSVWRSWGYWHVDTLASRPNRRLYLVRLTSVYDTTGEKAAIRLPLYRWEGQALTPSLLTEIPFSVQSTLLERGYLYASVGWQRIICDSAGLCSGTLRIQTGPLVRLDTLLIRGKWPAPRSAFYQITGLRPGQPLSLSQIQKLPRRLRGSPYATLVDTPQLWLFPGLAWVEVTLRPKNASRVDGALSLLPSGSGPSPRPQIIGHFEVSFVSPLRLGERIEARFAQLPGNSQRLNLLLAFPYLLRGLVEIGGTFSLWRQDSSFLTRDIGARVRYRLTPTLSLTVQGIRTTSRLLATLPYRDLVWPPPKVLDLERRGISLGWEYRTTESRAAPHHGWDIHLWGTQGRRTYLRNPGLPRFAYERLPTAGPYQEAYLSLERYTPIGAFLTARSGLQLFRYWSQGFFENELLRLGGEGLRGFAENLLPVWAYGRSIGELRLKTEEEGFLAAFGEVSRLGLFGVGEKWTYGTGIALQSRLAAGLLRITFATGRIEGTPWDLRRSVVSLLWVSEF